jgi:spermidine synthase
MRVLILSFLFFLSGFAALIYQVLWVRELGLLFGSTAHAAAIAISIFFIGISTGSWFWGSRISKNASPLFWFGVVEIGVAISASGYFFLADTYHSLYPVLFEYTGESFVLNSILKIVISLTILFLPSFLMGGTFPLLGQYLVKNNTELGNKGSFLYFINTLGSTVGVIAAGFYLPLHFGFKNTYIFAIMIDFMVGASSIGLSYFHSSSPNKKRSLTSGINSYLHSFPLPRHLILLVSCISGVASIAAEVLWTRLFSQVLQNSTYTYSLVLSVFLLSLVIGGLLANVLCRIKYFSQEQILILLLHLSGIFIVLSPWSFYYFTEGFSYLGGSHAWNEYLVAVYKVSILVIVLPGIICGAVVPYLLRLFSDSKEESGSIIGTLICVNTIGSVFGSFIAGFILLPLLGVWKSIFLIALIYPLTALMVSFFLKGKNKSFNVLVSVSLISFLLTLLVVGHQPKPIGVKSSHGKIIKIIEGSHATAAVVEGHKGNRTIQVNTNYTLGSSFSLSAERNQTIIPLLLHASPKSVFYLGMGTGITAGASLDFDIERVLVCELLPEVVKLSELYFKKWINGLFDDSRAQVIAEDGRNCLSRSNEKFDLIISDLFVPWKAGTGNLYTKEHYETSLKRLNDRGLYVQWVPLYQVSEKELGSIANTMDQVFPLVTLWRGDFYASRSVVALIGHKNPDPLNPDELFSHSTSGALTDETEKEFQKGLLLRLYGGNVSQSSIFNNHPVNTDNFPYIEYFAPKTHRLVKNGQAKFLIKSQREFLYEKLRKQISFDEDTYLQRMDQREINYVKSGHTYSQYVTLNKSNLEDHAKPFLDETKDLLPSSFPLDKMPSGVNRSRP